MRFAARTFMIALFVLVALGRFLVGWLLLLAMFQPKRRRQEWFANCFVGLFRSLGATFLKVGQIMSTRPDLFPPHVIHALETLQDNVGPFAYEHVQRTSVEDLGKTPELLFAEFQPQPIASASVAQVHK